MTKKELAKYIAKKSGFTQKESLEMVNIVFDHLVEAVIENESVDLQGIGRFEKKYKKKRQAVDINDTSTTIEIPEFYTMGFKASDVVKEKFNRVEK